MTEQLTMAGLRSAVVEGEIDTVVVCTADMYGRLVGKRFHAQFFLDSGYQETHACDYLLANDLEMEPVPGYEAASWDQGYGDFAMVPDLTTLRRTPWLEATALVLCDVIDPAAHAGADDVDGVSESQPAAGTEAHGLPHSPRGILKRQHQRVIEAGLSAFVASELEFYLFDNTLREASDLGYRNLTTAGYYIEDYHVLQTTKEEPVMRAIRNGLTDAGIAVENTKGEWGPGQAEVNVRYADPVTMADNHVFIKNAVKEIAYLHDRSATFMAKWDTDLAGSSCHVHMSLWDAKGTTSKFRDDDEPFDMSKLMRHFVAGQLKYAPDITYFLAPLVNSYKRFAAGTFAPTKAIWSRDNRTAGWRLVGEGTDAIRIECRVGGADLNPYLAFAALLAAGLAGISEELELAEPFVGDAYVDESLIDVPRTLHEAADLLEGSTMLRAAFNDQVIDHYVHTARWEQSVFDRRVTDIERLRGFEQS